MALRIDPARRDEFLRRLQGFWQEEFDEELSVFRAERILDFVLETVGPGVFNQGVRDARRYLQERIDDLESEVWEPEGDL